MESEQVKCIRRFDKPLKIGISPAFSWHILRPIFIIMNRIHPTRKYIPTQLCECNHVRVWVWCEWVYWYESMGQKRTNLLMFDTMLLQSAFCLCKRMCRNMFPHIEYTMGNQAGYGPFAHKPNCFKGDHKVHVGCLICQFQLILAFSVNFC